MIILLSWLINSIKSGSSYFQHPFVVVYQTLDLGNYENRGFRGQLVLRSEIYKEIQLPGGNTLPRFCYIPYHFYSNWLNNKNIKRSTCICFLRYDSQIWTHFIFSDMISQIWFLRYDSPHWEEIFSDMILLTGSF